MMREGTIVRDTATGGLYRVTKVDGDIALVKAITPRGVEQGATVRRGVGTLMPDPYAQGYVYGSDHGRTGAGTFSSSDQLADPAMQDGYEDGYQDGWVR